jgi:transcriptional regulator with XRE-family HTH domain
MSENVPQLRSITRFGEKLNKLRTRQKLSMQSLARLMGHTAHGYISELESGKKLPTVEFVLRLARLFNVTTDELLKDELELEFDDGRRNNEG